MEECHLYLKLPRFDWHSFSDWKKNLKKNPRYLCNYERQKIEIFKASWERDGSANWSRQQIYCPQECIVPFTGSFIEGPSVLLKIRLSIHNGHPHIHVLGRQHHNDSTCVQSTNIVHLRIIPQMYRSIRESLWIIFVWKYYIKHETVCCTKILACLLDKFIVKSVRSCNPTVSVFIRVFQYGVRSHYSLNRLVVERDELNQA